jgi:adenine phosphoribosyltransferase
VRCRGAATYRNIIEGALMGFVVVVTVFYTAIYHGKLSFLDNILVYFTQTGNIYTGSVNKLDLKKCIREIADFPIQGILFRDITTMLKDSDALKSAVDSMADLLDGVEFDAILGPESRGFIFGMPLAYKLGKGFVPVRKAGKLPAETLRKEYALEYGKSVIEIHRDVITSGKRFVLVDDLLATGGTAKATIDLIEENGGTVVASVFFIELARLEGRKLLGTQNVKSLLVYE